MSAAYETLVRLILPEGILEYFELTDVRSSETGQLNIHLEEKNVPPLGYEKRNWNQKGSYPKRLSRIFQFVDIR